MFSLLFVCAAFFFSIALASEKRDHEMASPYLVREGKLPGVTWADDIHPIFHTRVCKNCHMRGNTMYVDELREFEMGLIDPKDFENPFYSYHELVYAEGPHVKMQGEILRDGQCCWPYRYSEHKQRRIWIGHPERSALVHKIERDYYDWETPPRFVEEGLRLRFRWGLPMPWKRPADMPPGRNEPIKMRSYLTQGVLYIKAWLGMLEPIDLPPRIGPHDIALIRYWVSNSFQPVTDGTAIRVRALNPKGKPVEGAVISFVGNFNTAGRREVRDTFDMKTGKDGIVLLSFPRLSVLTSFWFIKASKDGSASGCVPATITDGKETQIELVIPAREQAIR